MTQKKHEYTDRNIADGLPADYMCGCAKGELLGPCEHAEDNRALQDVLSSAYEAGSRYHAFLDGETDKCPASPAEGL